MNNLYQLAFNAANENSRMFLETWIKGRNEIRAIFMTSSNWFYIETKSIETGRIYFYAVGQLSTCQSSTFGDLFHFSKYVEKMEITEFLSN